MSDIDTTKQPIITKGVEFIKSYNKYLVLVISLIIAGISINDGLKNSNNNQSVSGNVSTAVMALLIGIGYFMFTQLQARFNNNRFLVGGTFGAFMLLAIVIYTFIKVDIQTFTFFAYLTGALATLILAVGLALLFYVFSNYLKSFTGWGGFFVYFLFYIPCLLLSFVQYVITEFKLTTSPVLVLFVVELLLLLLYVYIPKLIAHISSKDGIPVLEGSVFLNSPNTFSLGGRNVIPDMDFQLAGNINKTPFQNYSISMWTYINAHSTNKVAYNKESVIFDYGNGKPKVTYFPGDNPDAAPVYRIYFTTQDKESSHYELKMPMQRWNNLVFNYSSTHADLFVNGNLERTFSFANGKMPIINAADVITTGSIDGLHGAISNIRYYPKPLSKHRIATMYNVFMKKAPPTINL
jgi:hypothetical protein